MSETTTQTVEQSDNNDDSDEFEAFGWDVFFADVADYITAEEATDIMAVWSDDESRYGGHKPTMEADEWATLIYESQATNQKRMYMQDGVLYVEYNDNESGHRSMLPLIANGWRVVERRSEVTTMTQAGIDTGDDDRHVYVLEMPDKQYSI